MTGLHVGDLDQSVGGIPLVGVRAVVDRVAVGIVLIVDLSGGLDLVECIDVGGCSVNGLLGYASIGSHAGNSAESAKS